MVSCVRTFVVNTRTSHPVHTATKLEVPLNEAGPAVSLERDVRTTSYCSLPASCEGESDGRVGEITQ